MASIDPIQEEQIGLPPAVLVDRKAVPEWVSQRSRWSSFDRLLDKAPFLQQKRIEAREALLDRHNWSVQPLVAPKLIGRGIFKASIGELDWIKSQADDALAFGGYGPNADGQLSKKTLRSPHGPLTVSRAIPNFECDITGIEGISESKSAERYFSSVQAFGADFRRYKQTPVDAQGLATGLGHNEVRIRNPGTSDCFRVHTWDGRVFLCNSGGSHHFAMASYIAAQLKHAVPLCGRLDVVEVNQKTVEWLLANFVVFAVPKHFSRPHQVAMLAGSCYMSDGLEAINMSNSKLLLIERANLESDGMQLLLHSFGAINLAGWFSGLLRAQDVNKAMLYDKFNGRITYPSDLQ